MDSEESTTVEVTVAVAEVVVVVGATRLYLGGVGGMLAIYSRLRNQSAGKRETVGVYVQCERER